MQCPNDEAATYLGWFCCSLQPSSMRPNKATETGSMLYLQEVVVVGPCDPKLGHFSQVSRHSDLPCHIFAQGSFVSHTKQRTVTPNTGEKTRKQASLQSLYRAWKFTRALGSSKCARAPARRGCVTGCHPPESCICLCNLHWST